MTTTESGPIPTGRRSDSGQSEPAGRTDGAAPAEDGASFAVHVGSTAVTRVDASDEDGVEALLRSLGVVSGSGRLDLEPEFRTAWRERIVDVRDRNAQHEDLAARLGVDPGRLALEVGQDGFVATCDRTRVGCWPSTAALTADLGAVSVLEDRATGWQGLDAGERGTVLTALRLFLERCPNCDGAVVGSDDAWTDADSGTGSDAERGAGTDRTAGTETGIETDAVTPALESAGSTRSGLSTRTESAPAVECSHCGVVLVRGPGDDCTRTAGESESEC